MINNPTVLIGTANQVLVNGTSGTSKYGALTLTLPQNINSGAAPTFAGTNFTSIPNGALTNSTITVTGGTGLGVSGSPVALGGTLTLSNTGVTSNAAGSGISLSGTTGAVTITNTGVLSAIAGTGISVSGATGNVTFTNTGVTSLTAGTGISLSASTGGVTVNNTGVTSVELSLPSIFTVSGSPVTTTGTLTGTLASQSANTAFLAPNGSAGAPTFRALAYADLPIKLYAENPSTPTAPTATGTNASAFGSGASATNFGTKAFANGITGTAGDAQEVTAVLRNTTTTNAAAELFLDGTTGGQRLVLPDNSAWTFIIKIAARRTDATGTLGSWIFQGFIYRNSGVATTVLNGLSKTTLARIGGISVANDPSITADTTNGSLKVSCTGVSAQTIRWVASVQLAQVTN